MPSNEKGTPRQASHKNQSPAPSYSRTTVRVQSQDRIGIDFAHPFAMIPVALLTSGLSPRAIQIYGILFSHLNRSTGECFPSQRTLAQEADTSISTVKRSLDELVESGWLTAVAEVDQDGQRVRTLYYLRDTATPAQDVSDDDGGVLSNLNGPLSNSEAGGVLSNLNGGPFKNDPLTIPEASCSHEVSMKPETPSLVRHPAEQPEADGTSCFQGVRKSPESLREDSPPSNLETYTHARGERGSSPDPGRLETEEAVHQGPVLPPDTGGDAQAPIAPPASGLPLKGGLFSAPKPWKRAKDPPDVQALVLRHAGLFEQRLGEPYPVSWAKDGATMKRLLATYPRSRLEELQDQFFDEPTGSFAERAGFTVGAFSAQVPALIAAGRKSRPKYTDITRMSPEERMRVLYGG